MSLNDEGLRRSYQQGTRQDDRSGCPSAEALRHIAAGEAGEDERLQMVDHLADCADCAGEYRLIRELRDWAERESIPEVQTSTKAPVWTAVRVVAIAASMVLAVGLGWLVQQRSVPPTEMQRATQGAEAIPAPRVPVQGARLAQPPERLAWPALPEASYRVVLYDFQSLPIWESGRLADASVELPGEVDLRLATPGTYYWRVFYERGVERGHSPLFRFEVAP